MPAWRHVDDREGFEVLVESHWRFMGQTVGAQGALLWALRYDIEHDGEQPPNVRVAHLPTFARRARHEDAAHPRREHREVGANALRIRLTQ